MTTNHRARRRERLNSHAKTRQTVARIEQELRDKLQRQEEEERERRRNKTA